MSENLCLDWARYYVSLGWRVFPVHTIVNGGCSCGKADCKHPGKHPLTPNGFKAATTDMAQIEAWWTQCPWANIGIATGKGSGFFVIDIDPRHNGEKTWPSIEKETGASPGTQACTGGGGWHLYFANTPGFDVRNSAGKLGPGVDVRGEGGYVLVPPSVHISGGVYSWPQGFGPHERGLQQAPNALLERLVGNIRTADINTIADGIPIPDGQRNNRLFSLAGSLRRAGCTAAEIGQALSLANSSRCQPPLHEDEVQQIVASICHYHGGVVVPQGMSGAYLVSIDIPEPNWIIRELLPEGLCVLAGKPKGGKSWAAMDIAFAVAGGGKAFHSASASQGRVLFLALEDNDRRLQSRIKRLDPPPAALENVEFHTSWTRGDLAAIDQWLAQRSDAALVVIDTLSKFRLTPNTRNSNAYDVDYEAIGPIQTLAAQRHVTILVVHHLRKAKDVEDPIDLVTGSAGITGSADTVMVLQRARNTTQATLLITGRDISEQQLELEFDDGVWSEAGAVIQLSPEQQRLLDFVSISATPVGPKEAAAAVGMSHDVVRQLLPKLVRKGLLERVGHGKYHKPPTS